MSEKTTTRDHLKKTLQRIQTLIWQFAAAADEDVGRVENALTAHTGSKSNPHGVTAAQVGAAAANHTHKLSGSAAIPTTGWGSDSTATYPKYYDIAVSGVTASDRANVDIAPAALATAAACGLCPTSEALAGKIRVRAVKAPAASMAANYWIEKGA